MQAQQSQAIQAKLQQQAEILALLLQRQQNSLFQKNCVRFYFRDCI